MSTPPPLGERLGALDARPGGPFLAPRGFARLARALAATKPAGMLLHLGHCADTIAWIHDGLDYGTRLITVHEDSAYAVALDDAFRDDLRVTVHCQAIAAFLDDIAVHRFDLIVADPGAGDGQPLALAPLLGPGGLALDVPDANATLPEDPDLRCWWGDGEPGLRIVSRRAPTPAARRRGGRRARRPPDGDRDS